MTTAQESLQEAYALGRAGQLDEAERICRQILASEPAHAATLHFLGWLVFQAGRGAEALTLLQAAVAAEPMDAGLRFSLGELHRRLGQLPAAKACFQEAIGRDPALVVAWHHLGLIGCQTQDWRGAEAALREAVRLKPDLLEVHDLLSQVHLQQGDRHQALRDLLHVVECRPDAAEAHNNLGNLQHELGLVDDAIQSLQKATRLSPNAEAPHYNLGNVLRTANRLRESAESYRRAIELAPGFVPAQNNLGTVLQSLGDLQGAEQAFRAVVCLEPNSAEAHHNLGTLLRETRQFEPAKQALLRAVAIDPAHAPSHYNLGATLVELGEYDEARRHLLTALQIQPNYAQPHFSLGAISLAEGNYDEAFAHSERALAIDPNFAAAHTNLGYVLGQRGDVAAALARFDLALKLQPDLAIARKNRGIFRLWIGDFAAGWRDFEARWDLPGAGERPPGRAWNGESLAGRTILLYSEQGIGDTLQFIRYVPLVKDLGARVIFGGPESLFPLLRSCRGIDQFHGSDDPPIQFDTHASLMSLPRIFETTLDSIPAEAPYLSARPDDVDRWRRALPADGRLRVGISWQGNPKYTGDALRSIPLVQFAPLAAVPGVRLISLQKGFGCEQLSALQGRFPVTELGDVENRSLMDSAAIIKNLDLVITSDTALAHLAGALGVPVWVALSRGADWRWLMDREDSPWYPTMRLFRQRASGHWPDVFVVMADKLRALAAGQTASLTKAFELHRAGQLDAAEAAYQQLLALEPTNAEAWHLLGVAAHQRGKHAEAHEHICRAISLDPERFVYHVNLAIVHSAQGQLTEAIAELAEALRLEPNHAEVHSERGVLLAKLARWDEAAVNFRQALAIRPDYAPACNNLGNVLNQQGRTEEAIACFQQALRLDPNFAAAHNGLGTALYAIRQPQQALAEYRRALELDPNSADARNNIGQVLGDEGEFDAAISLFDEAARIDPDNASVQNNRGMSALLKGDFARGWHDYEARWQLPGARERPPGPAWSGEPLAGRTILLCTEQGLGDTLQFIRYASLVQARGARVILRCVRRLIPILKTCPGIDQFVGDDEPLPRFDVTAALVSLPGIFQTDLASIPAEVPYLSARPDLVEHWRKALPTSAGLRVGINWQGHPEYKGDHRRSIPLARFAPLAQVEGVRLFSMQKGAGVEQLADAPFAVEDLAGPLNEVTEAFCQTAAIIKNLDLVITSDTALAHLAGALAAPVWVAVPLSPDWRWLLARDDSPWYPTLRLFRQQAYGDWQGVFEVMADRLRNLAATRR